MIVNYSNGTDPFLEVDAEVRDQGRNNALWVRQQPGSLGTLIPLPTAGLGFDLSPTLHALKKWNTKHSRQRENRCISMGPPSFFSILLLICLPLPCPTTSQKLVLNSNNHFQTVLRAKKFLGSMGMLLETVGSTTSYSCLNIAQL